jgi:hypothetical protein
VTDQPTSQQPPEPAPGTAGPVPPLAFDKLAPQPTPHEASASGGAGSLFPADRPEVAAGAAFAGGLVLALILKRLAR